MIEVRSPGKLYIAGEYAVVEPGEPAVLVAVDRCLTARLSESADAGRVRSAGEQHETVSWTREGRGIAARGARGGIEVSEDYALAAIAAVEELRLERELPPRYFDIDITSELADASGRKFGLGSSAAVTAAVVSALDEFYGLGLSLVERFKLAMLASAEVSPRGSGGDLAASVFGGWIRYSSPDRDALRRHRATRGVAATLASAEAWAGCGAKRLRPPTGLQLLVGWTGSPASTENLVERSRRSGSTAPSRDFLSESRACVDALEASSERGAVGALDAIRRARRLLRRFGAESGVEVETEQLRELCDAAERHGAAGKPSGAGGGDCGIVLAPEEPAPTGILREWEAHDIRRLDLSVHPPLGGIDDF